ncbi:MAG: hypothetical protein KDA80_07325 [Planctomycetaceae bacterium]|nr:hypothetical protein [Planctomycetaceae bacterium]
MKRIPATHTLNQRPGATLTEVLMSLLIMSVGIVSVFSLFPVSILSSIRATQLTNAKILQENIVEIARTRPDLILGASYWQPNTSYNTNQLVVASPRFGGVSPSSNLYFQCQAGGTSGNVEPDWPTNTSGGPITDSGVTWTVVTGTQFVVDPLGFQYQVYTNNSGNEQFGHQNSTGQDIGLIHLDLETTLDQTPAELQPFFVQPDSWTLAREDVPTGVSATSVTLNPGTDLSDISAGVSNYRVTVLSFDGTAAAQRYVSGVSGTTINLSGANLPGNLDSLSEVGSIRIETFTPRYSWMATVTRSTSGQTKAQCVTFFNRSFNTDDEFAYDYTGGGTDTASLSWTSGTDPKPLIREGDFAFDLISGEWFQIVSASTGSGSASVTLDRALPSTPMGTTARMLFPSGIIKVFDLEL